MIYHKDKSKILLAHLIIVIISFLIPLVMLVVSFIHKDKIKSKSKEDKNEFKKCFMLIFTIM